MSYSIRPVVEAEIANWVAQKALGFHQPAAEGLADYTRGVIDLDRTWGAFDGTKVVGTLRSFATALTVGENLTVPAAALTNVTVAPTHRRKGLLTAMITSDLSASAERGEAVGILIASEWPIYGHFGYGPSVYGARYEIDTVGLRFRNKTEGDVEIIDRTSLRSAAPPLFEKFRLSEPGSIERSDAWWDRALHQVEVPGDDPPTGQCALYRAPSGQVEGYLRYDAHSDWDGMRPKGRLAIRELLALTPEAYQGLWDYCCSVDLLTTIEASDRPRDEQLPLLIHDGRAVKQAATWDFVWVRVLDVPRSLAGRRYRAEGRLVIEVVDPLGLAAGRYALEGGRDGASCSRTTEEASLTMPVATLGSSYLGGESFSRLAAAGLVDEERAGALATADLMFGTSREPWCTTWF